MLPETDLAWAAGLFEGEGTVTMDKRGRYFSLRAIVANTDKAIVDFFQVRWPGNVYHYSSPKKNASDKWVWTVYTSQGLVFIADVLPYIRTARMVCRMELFREAASLRATRRRGNKHRREQYEIWCRFREYNHRGTGSLLAPPPFEAVESAYVRGTAHKLAKLSSAQVVEIRCRATEPNRALAREFGVDPRVIRGIVAGTRYAVEGEKQFLAEANLS